MSIIYTDLYAANFPDDIDTLYVYLDPSESDLVAIQSYNTYYAAGDFTNANAVLDANPKLKQMIINAEKMNRIEHMIIAMQRFYFSDVQTFLLNAAGINASNIELSSGVTLEENAVQVSTDIAAIETDLSKLKVCGVTSGTATALTLVYDDFVLEDFAKVIAKLHVDNGASVTFNVNSTGAIPVYNSAGEVLSAGVIKQGSIVILVYNATNNRWYLASGGGSKSPTFENITATGTITATKIVGAVYE